MVNINHKVIQEEILFYDFDSAKCLYVLLLIW